VPAYGGEPAETVGTGELGLGAGELRLGDGDVEDALGLGDTVGLGLRRADGSALGDGAEEAVPGSGPGEEGAGGR
jgi:hypothetical protein